MSAIPYELQRASFLADRLDTGVRVAKKFDLNRVKLEIDEAEELLQLLRDSIRTAKQFGPDLHEFDGRCKPDPNQKLISR